MRDARRRRLRPPRLHDAPGPVLQAAGPNDVTIGVLGAADDGAGPRAAAPARIARRLPIYLTEFGIQSTPDTRTACRSREQVEYRAISERIAYDNPRVVSFSQYLLRDDEPNPNAPRDSRYGGFESGLRFADGKAKPSLPASACRSSAKRHRLEGRRCGASCGRRPARRRSTIQYATAAAASATLATVDDGRPRLLRAPHGEPPRAAAGG